MKKKPKPRRLTKLAKLQARLAAISRDYIKCCNDLQEARNMLASKRVLVGEQPADKLVREHAAMRAEVTAMKAELAARPERIVYRDRVADHPLIQELRALIREEAGVVDDERERDCCSTGACL